MAIFVFLFVVLCMMQVTVRSCPLQCMCQSILLDHRVGQEVDCSSLYLDRVPSISQGALRLGLSYNSLERVPTQAIQGLPELRELDLSNNRIQHTIPDNAFRNNIKLLKLDLSVNHIPALSPNSFVGLGRLVKLDLHDNLIASIAPAVLAPISVTTVMCLGDNQWHCGCEVFESILLRQPASEGSEVTCGGGQPTCVTPPNLYGRSLSAIRNMNRDEVCLEESTTRTSTSTRQQATRVKEQSTSAPMTEYPVRGGEGNTSASRPEYPGRGEVGNGNGNATIALDAVDGLPVAGTKKNEGMVTKEFVMYIAVILGVMLLFVFLLLAVVLSRMSSKRRRLADQVSDSWVYPWPLLQSQRRLPAALPASDQNGAASVHTVYDEIPFSMNEYKLEPGMEEARKLTKLKEDQSLPPLDKGKVECLKTAPAAQAEGFDPERCGAVAKGVYASSVSFDSEADTAAYVPMHRPKNVPFKDLYALSETFN